MNNEQREENGEPGFGVVDCRLWKAVDNCETIWYYDKQENVYEICYSKGF